MPPSSLDKESKVKLLKNVTPIISNNRTYWKTPFLMTCKKGQFDVVELLKIGLEEIEKPQKDPK